MHKGIIQIKHSFESWHIIRIIYRASTKLNMNKKGS